MTMLVYPQLQTGALCQFPIRKRHRVRTVINQAADGSCIKLADPAAELTEWQLNYAGLTDNEIDELQQFFSAAEGTLNGFTFLDPTANLFALSDQLDAADWQRDPFVTVTGNVSDPAGGTKAWRLSNTGAAGQRLSQTLQASAAYLYCFSAYVRSSQAMNVRMSIGVDAVDRAVGSSWNRITFASAAESVEDSVRFSLEAPAGASLDVYGIQVEPQAGASVYKSSTRGGVYLDAHLSADVFTVTSTDVNHHSCSLGIIHANHL
jgi:hypothetical protein